MNSFQRSKNLQGKQYLYEITLFYDWGRKKIEKRSGYITHMKDVEPVEG